MVKPGKRIALYLSVVLLAAGVITVAPRAEVSAETKQAVNLLILLGITEGPDPIPQVIWEPLRDVDPSLFLNREGAARGDGRPDAAFHPSSFWPHVVWAFHAGTDHDIGYSAWNGSGWGDVEFLTSTVSDDLDPRIFIGPGGMVYVVWWEAGTEQVWMSARSTGFSNWEDPEPVTGLVDAGRRPSVVVSGGVVRTAYERDASPAGQEIVVATRVGVGVYDLEVIALSQSTLALNVILHDEQGILWIDWRHSDTEFAYSAYDGGTWSGLNTLPWTDDSWARADEARRVIRGIVLSSD